MTSSKVSDLGAYREGEDVCRKCKGPLALRPYREYPTVIQVIFGASFVIFLLVFDHLKPYPIAIWTWCFLQIVLGVFLVRGRLQARRRVYRCVRCSAELPL